eukprot:Skav214025  [mRNA]  locus=scaffold3389:53260:58530:- [translate_table: standard]
MARHGATLAGGSSAPVAKGARTPGASLRRQQLPVTSPLEATVVLKVAVQDNQTVSSGQDLVVLDALVPEEGEGAAATTAAAAAANRIRVGGLAEVDGSAVWYGKTSGVKSCEGPSHNSIRLPPPRHHEEGYVQRTSHHTELLAELQQRLDVVRAGGGAKAVDQHHARGKALPRERIEAILDRVMAVLFADFGCVFPDRDLLTYRDWHWPCAWTRSALRGQRCHSERRNETKRSEAEAAMLKLCGTYYPMTVKKHLRAQQIAMENNLPCVYLVDSGGAYLPLQDEAKWLTTAA